MDDLLENKPPIRKPGRPKGSKSTSSYKLKNVARVLRKHGFDPVEKMVEIYPEQTVEGKRKIASDLLSYIAAKPLGEKTIPVPTRSLAVPEEDAQTSQLLTLMNEPDKPKENPKLSEPVKKATKD